MTETESAASVGGLTPYKQRREAGEVELKPRHVLLAEYMTFGTDHARAKRLGYPLNEPLALEQAADVLDIRRRNARQLTRIPAFQRLMAQLTGELRSGGRARAIHTLLTIMADVGENTAADRAVRVKAAKEIIGDEGSSASVTVNVNNQAGVRPGYVLVLRSPASAPVEQPAEQAAIIDRKFSPETQAPSLAEPGPPPFDPNPIFKPPPSAEPDPEPFDGYPVFRPRLGGR